MQVLVVSMDASLNVGIIVPPDVKMTVLEDVLILQMDVEHLALLPALYVQVYVGEVFVERVVADVGADVLDALVNAQVDVDLFVATLAMDRVLGSAAVTVLEFVFLDVKALVALAARAFLLALETVGLSA